MCSVWYFIDPTATPTAGCAVIIAPRMYLGCASTAGCTPLRHYCTTLHAYSSDIDPRGLPVPADLRRANRQRPPFVCDRRERPTVRRVCFIRIGGRFAPGLREESTSVTCSW